MTIIARGRGGVDPERDFFLAFFLAGAVGVVLGFLPPSLARWHGQADYPAPIQLQIHAGLYLAWVMLVAAQIGFVRRNDLASHRRMGTLGAFMVPAMVITSLLAETYSERFYMVREPGSERFFIVPLFSLFFFPLFTGCAIALRQHSAVHKRLIYLGTTPLFGAAWSRVIGRLLPASFDEGPLRLFVRYFLVTALFVVALAAFDWSKSRTIQPVTAIGGAMLAIGIALVCGLYYTPWWLATADAIILCFPGP